MSRRDLAQRYWGAYEATLDPPSGSAARNRARIRQRVEAGEVVDEIGLPSAAPPRRAAAGLVLVGKSAAVSVGLATATLLSIKLAVVGWSQLGTRPQPLPPAASPARDRAEPGATASARGAAVPLESSVPRTIPAEPAPPLPAEASGALDQRARPSRARGASLPPADRLRAEVELMDRARATLEGGDARTLWRMMDEHARRFPTGALAEERQAWRAVAACRLGHPDAATRARRFLRAHPRSAQARKVRRACDGLPFDRMTD